MLVDISDLRAAFLCRVRMSGVGFRRASVCGMTSAVWVRENATLHHVAEWASPPPSGMAAWDLALSLSPNIFMVMGATGYPEFWFKVTQ